MTAIPLQTARPPQPNRCIVCGPDHPYGLHLQYRVLHDGSVLADWSPTVDWEGFRGIVHGGIISTVLDEAMSKAVAASGCDALTGELRVRFRHRVVAGERLTVRGWIVRRRQRLITTEAVLSASEDDERAHAWAAFMATTMPRESVLNKPGIGRKIMRIAVPTDDGFSVAQHFGRSKGFLVFEAEDGRIKRHDMRPNGTHQHVHLAQVGCGENHGDGHHEGMAAILSDCEAIVCRNIGHGAVAALEARGMVKFHAGKHESAHDAVLAYLSGELLPAEETSCHCDH